MNDKLKILEMMDSYYPIIEGPCNVIKNYTLNLNKKGKAILACPKANKKTHYVDKEDFEVLRINALQTFVGYGFAFPSTDKKFKKRLEEENFDVIHVHSPFSVGHYAVKYGKKHHIPVVATLHTKFYDDFMRVTKSKAISDICLNYIMYTINNADKVWTVNNASCRVLREYGYKGEIEVVRNGTDLTYPKNSEELIDKVNTLHNLKGQKNVLIFVGRTVMNKNLKLLADSLKILKDEGEDFKMIFVGDGPDMSVLKETVKNNDLTDRFIFTGAIRDRELLQGYYLRSDLFLFPSVFDTSSLVPIEAACHKLPTLLIENSCTAEGITDNENGFLAKETNEDYARKIKEIIKTEGLKEKVGENAHKTLYRTWEMVADEVYEKYIETIKEYHEKHKEVKSNNK